MLLKVVPSLSIGMVRPWVVWRKKLAGIPLTEEEEEMLKKVEKGLEKARGMAMELTGVKGVAYVELEDGSRRWMSRVAYELMVKAGRKVKLIKTAPRLRGISPMEVRL